MHKLLSMRCRLRGSSSSSAGVDALSATTLCSLARFSSATQQFPHAFVHPTAKIGARCRIEPFAYIGEGVEVGDDTSIGANATLVNCSVGRNVVVHAGVCIGQDGFGFALAATGEHAKKPQELRVEVHDDVEIGANCTIDRGSWRNTVLGKGSKLDNLIQIGHNVQLGPGCVLAAQTGIAGSTTLGRNVHVGGQVGIAQHLRVGDNVRIAAKSGVLSDLAPNAAYGGTPAVPITEFRRQVAHVKRLGTMSYRQQQHQQQRESRPISNSSSSE